MRKRFFSKLDSLLLIIGLILALVATWHWFSGNSHLNFVDALIPIDQNSIYRLFYNLDPHVFPWNAESNWSWIPYWLMFVIPSTLFHSVSVSQHLLYVGIMFFSIINFYLLAGYFFEKISMPIQPIHQKIIRFAFAIYYTFNLYTFYYGYFMFNPDIFIVASLPLNLLALFKLFPLQGTRAHHQLRWTIIFFVSLLLMDSGFLTYIFFAQYAGWIAMYIACYVLFGSELSRVRRLFFAGIFSVLIFLSQWWWFLPAAFNFVDLYAYQASIGTTRFFNGAPHPSQLLNSMRILGIPLMNGNPFSWNNFYTENNIFTFSLFLIPFFLLFFVNELKKIQNRRMFIFFLIMLVLSLFLIKFNNPPFAFIMDFAFNHLPFFGAFRDSFHKAGPFYLLPYLSLSCLGAGLFISRIIGTRPFLTIPISATMICLGIVITGPFFLFMNDNVRIFSFYSANNKYEIRAKTRIPPEYYDLKNNFEQECRGKIVLVIPRGGWMASAIWPKYNNSYMALDLLKQIINCTFINTFAFKPQAEAVAEAPFIFLQKGDIEGLKKFLYTHQIQYILIRNDNIPNSFANWLYVDPSNTAKHLDQDADFEKKIINEYFTRYQLRNLAFTNTYGFALSSSAIYTNSPLHIATDVVAISQASSETLGQPILHSTRDLNLYSHTVGTFIAQGICEECRVKDEVGRLTLGSKKMIQFSLDIVKDGVYTCLAHTQSKGFTILDSTIGNGKKSLTTGRHTATVSYEAPMVLAQKDVVIETNTSIEFPLPRLTERNYHLRFDVKNPHTAVEIIFANRPLLMNELQQSQLNPEAIVFTHFVSSLETTQQQSRIFQLDEFNSKPYHLYIRTHSDSPNENSSIIINNLLLEQTLDANYLTLTCSMIDNPVFSWTKEIDVEQINTLEYRVVVPKNFTSGFLTFNKNFAPGWEAYSYTNGKKYTYPHIQSGYANGWYVHSHPSGDIIVSNKQQRVSEANALVTFALFAALFYFYAKTIHSH